MDEADQPPRSTAETDTTQQGLRGRFRVGQLVVDADALTISAGDEDCAAEPTLVRTLLCLMDAHPAVLSKDALIEQVWGGRYVSDAAVHKTISLLRRLFESHGGGDLIRTRHRVGYQLAVAPEPLALDAAQSGARSNGTVTAAKPVRLRFWTIFAVLAVCALLVAWFVVPWPANDVEPAVVTEGHAASGPTASVAAAALEARSDAELLELAEASTPGNLELAREAVAVVLGRTDPAGDPLSNGRAELQLGLIEHHAGDNEKAIPHLLRARDVLRRSDDQAGLAKALEQLAAMLISLGSQPDLTEQSLDQALSLRQALGDASDEAALRSQRSGFLLAQGRLEAAREEATRLAELAQSLGDAKLEARAAEQNGDIALRLGQLDMATPEFRRMLDIASVNGMPLSAAVAAQRLGRIAGMRDDFVGERRHLEAARNHLLSAGRRGQLPIIDYGIGTSFEREGRRIEAREAYRRALDGVPAEPPGSLRVDIQVNLARLAVDAGDQEEASRLLVAAERDARLSGDSSALASVRINQGFNLLAVGGSPVAALDAATEVAELLSGRENWEQQRNQLALQALALLASERPVEAGSSVRQLREEAERRGDSASVAQADFIDSMSLLLQGDFFAGYAAYRRARGSELAAADDQQQPATDGAATNAPAGLSAANPDAGPSQGLRGGDLFWLLLLPLGYLLGRWLPRRSG